MQQTNLSTPRIFVAVAAIAFGAGLTTMAGVGMYYEKRSDQAASLHRMEIDTLQKAHRQESATQEGRHTRDKNRLHNEIRDQLIVIERLVRGETKR